MQTLFEVDDKLTRDRFAIDYDRKGDRLLVRSAIDNEGERTMVLIDARTAGRRLAESLLEALGDAPAPKARKVKTPRRVELA